MGYSLVIQPTGEIYTINLKPDADDHLIQMREHLDCQIVDVVRLTADLDMWIDDEGMYNHEVNPGATLLARAFGLTHQPYFGPALLCSHDGNGDSVDIEDRRAQAIMRVLLEALNK